MPVVTKKGASTLISSAMRKSIAAASVVSSSDSDEDEKNEGIVPDLLLASVDTPIARVIEECQSIMKLGKASLADARLGMRVLKNIKESPQTIKF